MEWIYIDKKWFQLQTQKSACVCVCVFILTTTRPLKKKTILLL